MLISISRIATTIISASRLPPQRSISRRVLPLLLQSPLTTVRDPQSMLETLKDYGFTDAQIEIIARKLPQSVLKTFREYGFTNAQIDIIARKLPQFISCSGDLVCAKMNYLCQELGLDRPDLIKIVTSYPGVLRSSLKNAIIPSINYLESMFGSRCSVIRLIVRAPWLLHHTHTRVAAKVSMLKDSCVSDSNIRKLLFKHHWTLVYRNLERFRSLLDSVLSAEFHPSAAMFVHAFIVKSSMSSSTWEKKIGVFLSFGWSAKDTELAFRRCPFFYAISEERLRQKLDFAMNVLGMQPTTVLAYKMVIMYSIEGTLFPRCCVLNVLMKKGLVKKDMKMPSALCKSKQTFARLFVEKYQDRAPEVLEAYHGKMQFSGFDHEG